MGDFYTEQLVKRQVSSKAAAIKVGLIALTVLTAIGSLFLEILLVVLVVVIVLDVILIPRQNVEYEYLYVNGDLDIDMIMNRQKRKKKFEMNINDMEMMARAGAPEVKNIQTAKTYDFSSGLAENRRYEMITSNQGQRVRVIFEPNDTIIEGMRLLAPRKVIV